MTTKYYDAQFDGVRWTMRADSEGAGDVAVLLMPSDGIATIVVAPAASSNILVEFSASDVSAVKSGTALWVTAEGLAAGGVCSAKALKTITSTITAVRATFSAASSAVEIAQ